MSAALVYDLREMAATWRTMNHPRFEKACLAAIDLLDVDENAKLVAELRATLRYVTDRAVAAEASVRELAGSGCGVER